MFKYTIPDKIITKVCKWTSVQELKQSSFEKLLKGKDNNIIKTLNDKRDDQKLVLKNMIQPTKQEQLFLKMYINSL